jgi:hypothetical protein
LTRFRSIESSYAALGHEIRKGFKGSVISSLHISGKAAGRQLAAFQVVGQALAAQPLFGASAIGAIAFFKILGLLALHEIALLSAV